MPVLYYEEDYDYVEEENNECEHEWVYTGTEYGGEDERFHGEGRVYCSKCGVDGDG